MQKPAWCCRKNSSGPQLLLCWCRRRWQLQPAVSLMMGWRLVWQGVVQCQQRLQPAALPALGWLLVRWRLWGRRCSCSPRPCYRWAGGWCGDGDGQCGCSGAQGSSPVARRVFSCPGRLGIAAAWHLNKRLKQYQ